MANSKSLIAYFSRKGNNYVEGSIVNLPVGNTEVIAKKIQELTGSDMFHIKTVKSYPEDYTEATDVAQEELRKNSRPELTGIVEDMDSYDVIYIGYPNWWGTMPMAVFTFLESYDFSGKTIIPYCTHEGSGLGRSVKDIKKLCPGSSVLDGLAIKGSNVNSTQNDLSSWLHKLGMSDEKYNAKNK
jgi:flavodoxin